ncbi:GNAT family N-acetyltransferase [Flavobacterium pallidum]|uniref:N-acetyltransferase domain-containing protein n=1 Tax=Flavobacterium pallidum TaxID=2172098 RepID=A0A2S1SI08_9FLAO|nr:GNAT family N-acetyltransferase [Flavobacterium pallidum]AWI25999.1 hypothetical protein HYN49_08855 [Flavobacterium pallidum]
MMEIKTLENIPLQYLAETFNAAFADYILPFQLTQSDLESKMLSENIRLEDSVGVFTDTRLVGFMLIGTDLFDNKNIAYNAGTGVIPEFRGQQLTQNMYAFLAPYLLEKGITTHQLEVITKNERAISTYKKIGFKQQRLLNCFKGNMKVPENDISFKIDSAPLPDETVISKFGNHRPAYQNSFNTIKRNPAQHICYTASAENTLAGYIVFSEANGRVKQFGVHPGLRKLGIGHALFHKVQQIIGNKPVTLINLDTADKGSINFLEKIGFEETLQQFEMRMEIN